MKNHHILCSLVALLGDQTAVLPVALCTRFVPLRLSFFGCCFPGSLVPGLADGGSTVLGQELADVKDTVTRMLKRPWHQA